MIECAISPCPNDTVLFGPWILGLMGERPTVHFADIEQLNQWALEGRYPLIKVSMACMAKLEDYELLPVGAALGFHVGPKIIAREKIPLEEARLAIPGRETTAHLLLKRLGLEPKEKLFCLFHEISELLRNGEVDAGLIIHESRFTFREEGFVELMDLGEMWQLRTKLPLPLGGLACRKGHPLRAEIISTLQRCYDYPHRDKIMPFIKEHAQFPEVASQHIETYVNSETRALSQEGWDAIERLTDGKVTRLCCSL